jgi:hypothetical protein
VECGDESGIVAGWCVMSVSRADMWWPTWGPRCTRRWWRQWFVEREGRQIATGHCRCNVCVPLTRDPSGQEGLGAGFAQNEVRCAHNHRCGWNIILPKGRGRLFFVKGTGGISL